MESGDYVTTSDGKTIVDHENIQRWRLRVDARQWAAARLAPKRGHLLAGSVQHPLGSSRGGPTASMGSGRTEGAHVGRNQRHGRAPPTLALGECRARFLWPSRAPPPSYAHVLAHPGPP